jgi:hypothetical protein
MASNMLPLLRVSVSQVGFQPTVRLGVTVSGRVLTTVVFHKRWVIVTVIVTVTVT